MVYGRITFIHRGKTWICQSGNDAKTNKMKQRINLDGWDICVDWHALYYGQTFFVPSINTKSDRASISASAKAAGCGVEINRVVEADVLGLRIWITRPIL